MIAETVNITEDSSQGKSRVKRRDLTKMLSGWKKSKKGYLFCFTTRHTLLMMKFSQLWSWNSRMEKHLEDTSLLNIGTEIFYRPYLTNLYQHTFIGKNSIQRWLAPVETKLIPKSRTTHMTKGYRLITCQNLMYIIFTAYLNPFIYYWNWLGITWKSERIELSQKNKHLGRRESRDLPSNCESTKLRCQRCESIVRTKFQCD